MNPKRESAHYEIRVAGQLGEEWREWFDGLSLTAEEQGTTLIAGPVADQAALHGLLRKIRDMGVPLLSVTRREMKGEGTMANNRSNKKTKEATVERERMKAAVYRQYGPPEVLQLSEVAKPDPGERELLIRVWASTVSTGDCNARGSVFVPRGFGAMQRLFFGPGKPKRPILGTVFAGEVVELGSAVTRFSRGDRLYGIDGEGLGGHGEYKCISEKGALAPMPAGLSYAEAAALPFGALTALHFLRDKGGVHSGQRVLVHGASGGVGSYAVQLAAYYGAEVTGVCSGANVELVRSLGARTVIDYRREDFTRRGERYDLIVDTVVGKYTYSDCKHCLAPNGSYLAVSGCLADMLRMAGNPLRSRKVVVGPASERAEDLRFIAELVEAGSIRPVIDCSYPLERIVEAHRHADSGHKRGSVVVTLS